MFNVVLKCCKIPKSVLYLRQKADMMMPMTSSHLFAMARGLLSDDVWWPGQSTMTWDHQGDDIMTGPCNNVDHDT